MATYLQGIAAIEYAEEHNLLLSKYYDRGEKACTGLTPDEARTIAMMIDPSLIYLIVEEGEPK